MDESQCYLDELFRDAVTHPPPNVSVTLPSWCADVSELHHYMMPDLSDVYENHIKNSPAYPLVIDLNNVFTFISSDTAEIERRSSGKEGLNATPRDRTEHRALLDGASGEQWTQESFAYPLESPHSPTFHCLSNDFTAELKKSFSGKAESNADGAGLFSRLRRFVGKVVLFDPVAKVVSSTPTSAVETLSFAKDAQGQGIIPLSGITKGTLKDILGTQHNYDDASRESIRYFSRRHIPLDRMASPLPGVEMTPIFDDQELIALRDDFPVIVYELLLVAAHLCSQDQCAAVKEVTRVYEPVLKISPKQKEQSAKDLAPILDWRGRRSASSGVIDEVFVRKMIRSASASSDFYSRYARLLMQATPSEDPPTSETLETKTFSLAVRATLFCGCLLPLYHLTAKTTTFTYTRTDIRQSIAGVAFLFKIPLEIVPFCHLHAQLIANNMAEHREHQCVYLRLMAKSVNHLGSRAIPSSVDEMGETANPILTPTAKYCYYVLQESFAIAMTPMPWLDTLITTRDASTAILALFMEACVALPSSLLSAFAKVDGQCLFPPYYNSSDFLVSFLSIFLGMGTLRHFQSMIPNRMHEPSKWTVEQMLGVAQELLNEAKLHSSVLSRAIPSANGLLLPSLMQMGTTILFLHWGILIPDTKEGVIIRIPESEVCTSMPLPDDFVSCVVLLFEQLVLLAPAEKVVQHISVTHMLRAATILFLSLLSSMISRWESKRLQRIVAVTNEKMKASGRTLRRWDFPSDTRLKLPKTLVEVVQLWLPSVAELPIPLGERAVSRYIKRIDATIETLSMMVELAHVTRSVPSVCDIAFPASLPLKVSLTLTPDGKAPPGYVMSERIMAYLRRERSSRLDSLPSITELLSRLRFVLFVSAELDRFVKTSASLLSQVERVTGASSLKTTVGRHWAPLLDRVQVVTHRLFHALMAHVWVHSDTSSCSLSECIEKYMLSERKTVRRRKHTSPHSVWRCPRTYPKVTMNCLLQLAEQRLYSTIGRLFLDSKEQERKLWIKIQLLLGTYLIAVLYSKCFIEKGVYYTPAQAHEIRYDSNVVRNWLRNVLQSNPLEDSDSEVPQNNLSSNHSSGFSLWMLDEANVLLRELHYAVHNLLSVPSAVLVHGGKGIPPFSNLPPHSAETPWSQHMIQAVLSHRTDADARRAISSSKYKCFCFA